VNDLCAWLKVLIDDVNRTFVLNTAEAMLAYAVSHGGMAYTHHRYLTSGLFLRVSRLRSDTLLCGLGVRTWVLTLVALDPAQVLLVRGGELARCARNLLRGGVGNRRVHACGGGVDLERVDEGWLVDAARRGGDGRKELGATSREAGDALSVLGCGCERSSASAVRERQEVTREGRGANEWNRETKGRV
jgi:hypothetical protein